MSKNSGYRKSLGSWGENYAISWLETKNYQLVEKNFHSRYGEIDLIMVANGHLTAIEVKTRKSDAYGIAEFSITQKKYLAIQKTMQVFFESRPEFDGQWQLDVVVIEAANSKEPEVLHYENVYLDYLNE